MYAIISDLHSNIEAVEVVLDDIKRRNVDEIYCLGDMVGYGPDPIELMKLIGSEVGFENVVQGNHDEAAINGLARYFTPHARTAIEWTKEQLGITNGQKGEYFNILKNLNKNLVVHDMLFIHDTPAYPNSAQYLITGDDARVAFPAFDNKICLVGHSHLPVVYRHNNDKIYTIKPKYRERQIFEEGQYIINVGSVGQPRDGDSRVCYILIDDSGFSYVRLQYDFKKTQQKIIDAGLPPYLAHRLENGR